ncbi:hypothetical protein, partial [Leptospira kmetyi]|uniref:hypothetical protein n=1 Tax=Leptospira kmetyi TaxID=408139 RepID=UPI00108272EF
MGIVFLILSISFIAFVIFNGVTSVWDIVEYLSYFFMALGGFYFLKLLLGLFGPDFKRKRNENNSNDWSTSTDSGSLNHFGNSIDSENSNHSSFWDWIGGDSGDSGSSDGSDGGGQLRQRIVQHQEVDSFLHVRGT